MYYSRLGRWTPQIRRITISLQALIFIGRCPALARFAPFLGHAEKEAWRRLSEWLTRARYRDAGYVVERLGQLPHTKP